MTNEARVFFDEDFGEFRKRVNIIFVVDHAGRAGNGFFQTIFDQHPQVIACPWMHYVYSYVLTDFGDQNQLDARAAWEHWRGTTYFRLLYDELDEERRGSITKMGGDPDAPLNRDALRRTFDKILQGKEEIERRDLILAIFYSYAIGLGRDTSKIRYIMCTDSISLRYENAMTGFCGKVVDFVVNDFPGARLVHLERDPRAGLASSNHQFVNQLGNMYGLKLGNFWSRLARLRRGDFDWDSVFVFGFWLIYFRRTFDAIMRKRADYGQQFVTILNEELNLNFSNTMRSIASELGVASLDSWTSNFQPTMLGRPWTGTGAYNSRYQKHVYGPLKNDSEDVARKVTGPNAYVTKRWRTQLSPAQIFVVEGLLAPELKEFGYEFLFWRGGQKDEARLRRIIWRPLPGELPSLRWVLDSRFTGMRDLVDRVFYCVAFPIFYVASRIVFLSIVRTTNVFKKS